MTAPAMEQPLDLIKFRAQLAKVPEDATPCEAQPCENLAEWLAVLSCGCRYRVCDPCLIATEAPARCNKCSRSGQTIVGVYRR